jgi:FtsP/CotA-like multicopper oxidase with cupredoxin domain
MAKVSRREVLKLGLAASAATAFPIIEFVRAGAGGDSSPKPDSPPVEPFTRPLAAPPIARPSGTAPMRFSNKIVPRYDVYQREVQVEILPGRLTTVHTYTQEPRARVVSVPLGPTFLAERGNPFVVRQFNQLGRPTSVHLHGGLVASEDDGHPSFNRVFPGTSYDYTYNNEQIAANLWYHDHTIFETAENVYFGLAGFYVFTDAHERSLGLPSGRFDVPLVVQDRAFRTDGSLFYPKDGNLPTRQGAFGDTILVNGVPTPFLAVEPRKYRFRILNGSNARIYDFRLSTGDPFLVIGSEHGFTRHPVETDHLFMATGERYGIVIDFAKYRGRRVVLLNTIAPDPFGDPVDGDRVRNVMAFDVAAGSVADDSRVPSDLAHPGEDEKFDTSKAVAHRSFEFNRTGGMWTINGEHFDENKVTAQPRRNTVEVWDLVNKSGGWLHPAHLHLIKWKLLERDGGPVRPWEMGFKDMASLGADEAARVAVFFEAPEEFAAGSQSRGLYPFHCHNVEHEDHDMMLQVRLTL